MAIFALAHEPIPILNTESGTKISMATVNTMAEEMAVSELEEDQDLLIEALRKHLTYVEVNASRLHNTVTRELFAASDQHPFAASRR